MKKVLLTLAALTAVSIANAQQTYNGFRPCRLRCRRLALV